MKQINHYFLLFTLVILSSWQLKAQEGPFLEELYDVDITLDVIYGVNATILPVLGQVSPEALPRPLNMDVYQPVGDDNSERPVMMVFHTGNFLPFPSNNGTGGTIRDSTVVEVCTRLAKRGYVACAVDYRLGWNPIDPSQDIRTFFLINAAYRGVQDARTAARYMRLTAVDGGNPYNISTEKIGIWGIGTGGYIAAAVATLDEYIEVVIPKFLIDLGAGVPVPMVIEAVNGDINGTSVGIVPPGYPVLPVGDTLCYPNHVTYANGDPIPSDYNLIVNNGGALGDISWADENIPPWISFHVPNDPFAPYTNGTLTVPGTGDPADPSDDFAVVEVSGSYDIQQQLASIGSNAIFDQVPNDYVDYAEVADARNDGAEGLFPFPNNAASTSAPWDFYAADHPNVPPNPAPEPELAKTYWDTMMVYAMPRACLALNLECDGVTSTEEITPSKVGFTMAPNPAQDVVNFTAEFSPIKQVQVYDLSGRLVIFDANINAHNYQLERRNLADGIYVAKVVFEEGYFSEKIVFE